VGTIFFKCIALLLYFLERMARTLALILLDDRKKKQEL
jgi:hypothetical protein